MNCGAPRLIVLGSRNPGKLREFQAALAHLPIEVRGVHCFPGIESPEETGATFAENARLKALSLARQLGLWVLADDSGICVDALDGRPGVLSALYGGRDISDPDRVALLLAELGDTEWPRRTARFVCALALAAPEGILLEAQAACEGFITRQPRGQNGFGYDPVFYYPEFGATFAEVPLERKNTVSHRGRAIADLARQLQTLLRSKEEACGQELHRD